MTDTATTKNISHWKGPLGVTALAGFLILVFFGFYLTGTLGGNINWHMLPSVKFGPPPHLAEQGFDTLYKQVRDGGWDGQMYFYTASDLLDQHGTGALMDVASYRYQRIGLSLASAVVSNVLLGTPYVRGSTYFWTNVGIALLATLSLAYLLRRNGVNPLYALFWSCFISTILCITNGMPDVTGDAFFIIAIVAFVYKRAVLYAVSMALACLCREAFVLPAGILFGLQFLSIAGPRLTWFDWQPFVALSKLAQNRGWLACLLAVAPIAVFLAWQGYLHHHFGILPGQQAGAVIEGTPFRSLLENLIGAITKHHRVMAPDKAFNEVGMLAIFIVLFGLSCMLLLRILLANDQRFRSPAHASALKAVALAILPLLVLYAFFGNVVMEHYTGYLKASGIFVISIVLHQAALPAAPPASRAIFWSLMLCVLLSDIYLISDRLVSSFPHHYKYVVHYDDMETAEKSRMECVRPLAAEMSFIKVEEAQQLDWLRKLYRRPLYKVFHLRVKNTSGTTFIPVRGEDDQHGVYLSYQWIDKKTGKVVEEGIRSVFQKPFHPGEEIEQPALVRYKNKYAHLRLSFAVIQVGCGWAEETPRSRVNIETP